MTPVLRRSLYLSFSLTTLGFIQLYLFSADTDRFFAWTIEPPLTAAFLGAGFGAGVVLVAGMIRRGTQTEAMFGLWTVMVFIAAMTVATFVHLGRLHLDSDISSARFAAWLWTAVYVSTPILGFALLLRQPSMPFDPRPQPMPTWLRALSAVIGVALLAAGLALEIRAGNTGWWPWQPVPPLSARAIASWLLAIGLAALAVARINNLGRVGATPAAFATFGVLAALALARYSDVVSWGAPITWAYLAVLTGSVVAGLAGMRLHRSAR